MQNLHFISGLPRSGSTLLSAILTQNPNFHASISSPLAAIFNNAWNTMGNNEASDFITDVMRKEILIGIVQNYYGQNDTCFTGWKFDTSRIWTARTHILFNLFQKAKMICCVRNVAWVLDSLEQIYRKQWIKPTKLFNAQNSQTVFERCNQMVAATGMVGSAYNALREACFSEFNQRLILVDYDRLVADPEFTMKQIYNHLEIPYFEKHQFNDVEFGSNEWEPIYNFDERLNANGLHKVSGRVQKRERQTILPPEIWQQHGQSDFWNKPEFRNMTGIRVI